MQNRSSSRPVSYTHLDVYKRQELEDENGVRADPNSQGEGKAMLYAQENQILIQLEMCIRDRAGAAHSLQRRSRPVMFTA